MSELNIACILMGGPDHRIEAGGKVYHFEMHPYCGPNVLTKRGAIADTQPNSKSPFWDAVTLWDKQGRRVGDDGLCVWGPRPTYEVSLRHLGGRHYLELLEGGKGTTHTATMEEGTLKILKLVPCAVALSASEADRATKGEA